eukprot:358106-Chlamydomonas_euryale.AAC.2
MPSLAPRPPPHLPPDPPPHLPPDPHRLLQQRARGQRRQVWVLGMLLRKAYNQVLERSLARRAPVPEQLVRRRGLEAERNVQSASAVDTVARHKRVQQRGRHGVLTPLGGGAGGAAGGVRQQALCRGQRLQDRSARQAVVLLVWNLLRCAAHSFVLRLRLGLGKRWRRIRVAAAGAGGGRLREEDGSVTVA